MARPGETSTPGFFANVRDKHLSAAYEKMRAKKPPPSQSRFKPWFEELERRKDSRVEKENLEPKGDIGLREDHQAKHSEVEEELGTGMEPAASTGAIAADDGDNGSLDVDRGSIVHSTCDDPVNGVHEEAVDGTHRTHGNCDKRFFDGTYEKSVDESEKEALSDTSRVPVDGDNDREALDSTREETVEGSHDNQFLEGTHEAAVEGDHRDGFSNGAHDEPADGNRDNQSLDGTCEEPVAGKHEEIVEGTPEETVDTMYEEVGGGWILVESMSNTSWELVPGKHNEPPSTSSHHEHESPSEPQPDPPKRRGRPKYKRLAEFKNLRPIL
ncbi:hypothetical protein F5883DRAFT_641314 [Diaporthe sp. PMI_573]|nr:hypothetical protein F5883DRAFT_641314 [Diaporthaceae sp. PMI_573]